MDQADERDQEASGDNFGEGYTADNSCNNANSSELVDLTVDKGPNTCSVDNAESKTRDCVSEGFEHASVDEHVTRVQKSTDEPDFNTEHDMSGVELSVDQDMNVHISETEQGSQYESSDTECSLTLTDLPLEILLHVASFMPPKDIICTLCQVCKSLYHIFSHDHYWKTRISLRWPGKYPVLDSKFCSLCKIFFGKKFINHILRANFVICYE